MDRIRFITHRDQHILLVDCSHCTAAEIAALSDLLPDFVTREPLGSVLLLGDFTGAQFSREAVEHIKISAVFHRPDKKQVLDYAATGVIWTANPRFRRRLSSCRTCLPFARLSKWFAPRS